MIHPLSLHYCVKASWKVVIGPTRTSAAALPRLEIDDDWIPPVVGSNAQVGTHEA